VEPVLSVLRPVNPAAMMVDAFNVLPQPYSSMEPALPHARFGLLPATVCAFAPLLRSSCMTIASMTAKEASTYQVKCVLFVHPTADFVKEVIQHVPPVSVRIHS